MAIGSLVLSFWDYDKEVGTVKVPFASYDETTFVAAQAELDALRAAINGVTLGVNWKETRVLSEELIPGTPPNDPTCQREVKWLVRMTEADTMRSLRLEIPMADYALLNPTNKGKMLITSGAGQTLKNAIEASYVSDREKTVTVDEIVLVGRNS